MADRFIPIPALGAAGVAVGLCCGVLVLLSAGVLTALAGLGLGSWHVLAAGAVVVVAAPVRIRRRRRTLSRQPARQIPNNPRRGHTAMSTDINLEALDQLLAEGALLIEVLPEGEFREEHLPDAINLPLKHLTPESVAHFDRASPIVVYCWDSL